MADRGQSRGGARGGSRGGSGGRGGGAAGRGGGGGGGARGGSKGGGSGASRGGGRGGGDAGSSADRQKRAAILDLAKYVDKKVRVKFTGGREVIGVLKGYDQLMNMVMDEVEEVIRDPVTGDSTDETRALGLAVLKGSTMLVINPADGFEQIANPFAAPE